MSDSIFTKVIRGEVPSHRIYEDDKCIVIMDIRPIQPGHCLVIPKEPITYIWDADDELYIHLWAVSRKIADRIKEVLNPNRVGIIVDGEAVPHAHIQIIPLNEPGDLHAIAPKEPDHDALRQMAEKLRLN